MDDPTSNNDDRMLTVLLALGLARVCNQRLDQHSKLETQEKATMIRGHAAPSFPPAGLPCAMAHELQNYSTAIQIIPMRSNRILTQASPVNAGGAFYGLETVFYRFDWHKLRWFIFLKQIQNLYQKERP